jgi:hypothetical protein
MINRSITKLFTKPFHCLLIILFFIIHGYTEYWGLLPLGEVILLLFILLLVGMFVFYLGRKLMKNDLKAGILTSLLLLIFLFYGVIEDAFSINPRFATFGRLRKLLPIIILGMVLLTIWLRKSAKSFMVSTLFLNILFTCYIFFDLGNILVTAFGKEKEILSSPGKISEKLNGCDTCKKPDIYLVILDEYWGSSALKNCLGYDNSDFENFLRNKGFYVVEEPHSNYSATLFSVASMLNMELGYDFIKTSTDKTHVYQSAVRNIRDNKVCSYLRQNGYDIVNYSIFDLRNLPTQYYNSFVPLRANLITNKTLYNRVAKILPILAAKHLDSKWIEKWVHGKIASREKEVIENSLKGIPGVKDKPVFTYIHLMMPHSPMLFDSNGNKMEVKYNSEDYPLPEYELAYLQYLVFTNRQMMKYLNGLLSHTENNAVILLMSDHGYRGIKKCKDQMYKVLNAVFLPSQNNILFYQGMSNVNQFRVLFNTLFHEKLPLVKDSIVF